MSAPKAPQSSLEQKKLEADLVKKQELQKAQETRERRELSQRKLRTLKSRKGAVGSTANRPTFSLLSEQLSDTVG